MAIHGIDLRDHADFSKPLDFLIHSPEDYVLRTQATENRWRSSDFLDCFASEGFEILKHLFGDTPVSLTSGGTTDVCELISQPFAAMLPKSSLGTVAPWITNQMRAKFAPIFHNKSLTDLSVLSMAIIVRKPTYRKFWPLSRRRPSRLDDNRENT
jgi:hypothetical protein